MNTQELNDIATRIRERFNKSERARERCLTLHRELIRASGLAIRATHRHEFEEAQATLSSAETHLREIRSVAAEHAQVYYAGFIQDAQKEYAEACLTIALVTAAPLPSPEDLQVEDASWLNGLGEAVGELRRYILDQLRQKDSSLAEGLLERMDEVYYVLTSMDYPDALTRGLRRTTDVARGCIEKTRGDLTQHLAMRNLEQRLNQHSS